MPVSKPKTKVETKNQLQLLNHLASAYKNDIDHQELYLSILIEKSSLEKALNLPLQYKATSENISKYFYNLRYYNKILNSYNYPYQLVEDYIKQSLLTIKTNLSHHDISNTFSPIGAKADKIHRLRLFAKFLNSTISSALNLSPNPKIEAYDQAAHRVHLTAVITLWGMIYHPFKLIERLIIFSKEPSKENLFNILESILSSLESIIGTGMSWGWFLQSSKATAFLGAGAIYFTGSISLLLTAATALKQYKELNSLDRSIDVLYQQALKELKLPPQITCQAAEDKIKHIYKILHSKDSCDSASIDKVKQQLNMMQMLNSQKQLLESEYRINLLTVAALCLGMALIIIGGPISIVVGNLIALLAISFGFIKPKYLAKKEVQHALDPEALLIKKLQALIFENLKALNEAPEKSSPLTIELQKQAYDKTLKLIQNYIEDKSNGYNNEIQLTTILQQLTSITKAPHQHLSFYQQNPHKQLRELLQSFGIVSGSVYLPKKINDLFAKIAETIPTPFINKQKITYTFDQLRSNVSYTPSLDSNTGKSYG
ncbi:MULTISPECIES: hypothetical protein [Cysteiniphilum]|uniref:hypothetical protein n=1 Tax=Cysteiniphilum TaxID=2056696 RepID=UPI00177D306C|nr:MULTISPECIES: hypothetical protein [Cysteiniphilum]